MVTGFLVDKLIRICRMMAAIMEFSMVTISRSLTLTRKHQMQKKDELHGLVKLVNKKPQRSPLKRQVRSSVKMSRMKARKEQ